MLVCADGLGHTPQTVPVLSSSAISDSTGPKVSRADQLLRYLHTLLLCACFSSCCFLVDVSAWGGCSVCTSCVAYSYMRIHLCCVLHPSLELAQASQASLPGQHGPSCLSEKPGDFACANVLFKETCHLKLAQMSLSYTAAFPIHVQSDRVFALKTTEL